MYIIKSFINLISGFISLDLMYKYHLGFLVLFDFSLNYSYDVLK